VGSKSGSIRADQAEIADEQGQTANRINSIFAEMKLMERYGAAKMFAMMFALELDRRLRADGIKGITVNSW